MIRSPDARRATPGDLVSGVPTRGRDAGDPPPTRRSDGGLPTRTDGSIPLIATFFFPYSTVQYTHMTTEPIAVDLFIRSLSPAGARGRPAGAIERLRSLVEAGTIDDYSVTVWGKEVEVESGVAAEEGERLVLDRVAALRSWAAERGVALDAFERREVSTVTGETYTVLTLPVMVLVESVGEEIACVAPCTTEGGVLTVGDRLGALEGLGGWVEGSDRRGDREPARDDRRVGHEEYDPAPS